MPVCQAPRAHGASRVVWGAVSGEEEVASRLGAPSLEGQEEAEARITE